ncbi:MAG: hypothetical protein LDLANPLL_01924 [Turneriella sp.]|nr:hypothetical protein [Turneriella sp.]
MDGMWNSAIGKFVRILSIFLASGCFIAIFAAKRILILDFRSIDRDPNFQYLEVSLTDSVRKYLHEKYEIVEPDMQEVASQMRDASFIFAEDLHNKNVALQLGLLTGQDVVLSGGFRQRDKGYGTAVISLEVFIIDVEKRILVKRIVGEMLVDSNLFTSIDKFSSRIVQEAKAVLPNKGEYDFDQYTPVRMTQFSILTGYNLNSSLAALRSNRELRTGARILPADLGGFIAGVEVRRDRFFKINRLIGYAQLNAQFINVSFPVTNETTESSARGYAGTLEAGLGYQIYRFKQFFATALVGGGFNYTAFKFDFLGLKNPPVAVGSRENISQVSGALFGPIASAGLRFGLQINRSLSWELGASYQTSFLRGSVSGNIITTMGVGLRL